VALSARPPILRIRPAFPHRKNFNGSFDSICRKCLVTIATSLNETDLLEAEAAHVCSGLDLKRLLYPEDAK
jgi:hypothetical protein